MSLLSQLPNRDLLQAASHLAAQERRIRAGDVFAKLAGHVLVGNGQKTAGATAGQFF